MSNNQITDSIYVAIMPERKGIIYKHTEYEITSKTFEKSVIRRFSDFVTFHDMLISRYPYRMVPSLPPKKLVGVDHAFIEIRRRALKRFLLSALHHPIISLDSLVSFFLTYEGSDMKIKIKDEFKGVPDEYMSDESSIGSKDALSTDAASQFGNSRQHIRSLQIAVTRIRDIIERTAIRQTQYATDLLHLGHELSSLSGDQSVVSTWATGENTVWRQIRQNCKDIIGDYATLAETVRDQACKLENDVVEELNMFIDLLQSHQELCDRHERGVLQDHQKSLQKMALYKKKHMTATVQGGSQDNRTEHLEQRIIKQENEILSLENRSAYSLICAQYETRFVHENLTSLYNALCDMASQECDAYNLFSEAWKVLKPKISEILEN